ncbi:hypothetical protein V2J09_016616 [Rumex salicifolius]
MWKLGQSILGGDDEEREESFFDGDTDGLCNLSPLQRTYGFAAALIAGVVLMFLSFIVFSKPIKFALLFTFGNILAIGSTAFLMGPAQQLQMMFDPVRLYATAVYLACVVLALICALLVCPTLKHHGFETLLQPSQVDSDSGIPESIQSRPAKPLIQLSPLRLHILQ